MPHQPAPEFTKPEFGVIIPDIEVRRAHAQYHGFTGNWSWSLIWPNEHRPRIEYGTASTPTRAFEAGLEALARWEELHPEYRPDPAKAAPL